MITENYASHTKDELLTEATSRQLEVTASSTKAEIISALEADDKSTDDEADDDPGASGIPKVEDTDIPEVSPNVPKDEDYKGSYVRRSDGEPYALAVMKEGGHYGRTHFARNSKHFWDGSEEDFRREFDKK